MYRIIRPTSDTILQYPNNDANTYENLSKRISILESKFDQFLNKFEERHLIKKPHDAQEHTATSEAQDVKYQMQYLENQIENLKFQLQSKEELIDELRAKLYDINHHSKANKAAAAPSTNTAPSNQDRQFSFFSPDVADNSVLTSYKAVDCVGKHINGILSRMYAETIHEDSSDNDKNIKATFEDSIQELIHKNVLIVLKQIVKEFNTPPSESLKGPFNKIINEKQTFIFPNQASYTVYPNKKK